MRRAFTRPTGPGAAILWDLLTFERLVTSTVVHLIYWAGLGMIALIAFGTLGAAVGVAIREGSILGILFAIPVIIAGLLVVAILVLLWRSFCEFYVAIFRISEDLTALRQDVEAERRRLGGAPRP
jgi:hypothetical protein